MSFFHFLKFFMNFLKGVVSICHGVRNTGQPGQINGFERYFQAFKLSIDVQLGAIELVTRVLGKTQILKFYQPHLGKQKPKTSVIAQTSAKAVDRLYARNCLTTSNFSIAII